MYQSQLRVSILACEAYGTEEDQHLGSFDERSAGT